MTDWQNEYCQAYQALTGRSVSLIYVGDGWYKTTNDPLMRRRRGDIEAVTKRLRDRKIELELDARID